MRLAIALVFAVACRAQDPLIDAARTNALDAISHLPDFLCTQQVTRDSSPAARDEWKTRDKLEILVGYTKQGERDRLEKIDGKPTQKNLEKLGGFQSKGDFGGTLANVFRPKSKAAFVHEKSDLLHGKPVEIYRFTVERPNSDYRVAWSSLFSHSAMGLGVSGRVFVDAETKSTMRIEMEADGLPATGPIHRSFEVLEYSLVEIAGRRYLLPSRVESRMYVHFILQRNIAVYENYRKFAAESGITFEGAEP